VIPDGPTFQKLNWSRFASCTLPPSRCCIVASCSMFKLEHGGTKYVLVAAYCMSLSPTFGAAGQLHLVVAFDQVGGIGRDGSIPWCLPPDLKRFRDVTSSLPETASPGSFNVVIMVMPKSAPKASLPSFCKRAHRAGRRGNLCPPSRSRWRVASTSSYRQIPNLRSLLVF
jgi:hypothetical protein